MQRIAAVLVFSSSFLVLASDARPEAPQPVSDQSQMARLVDAKLLAWEESFRRIQGPRSELDKDAVFDNNPAFRDLVSLGPSAVPHLMRKVEEGFGGLGVGGALCSITKFNVHCIRTGEKLGEYEWHIEEYPDMRSNHGSPDAKDVWLRWWRQGRRETPERFAALHADWKSLRADGKEKEAAEKYERIKDLGIDALPLIVQQVQGGDTDLMPIMSYLTDNESPAAATPEQCVSWWEANKSKWTLAPPQPVKAPTP